ncbi:hypothetical protein HWC99_gp33 [Flavobacterium phage vB_FspS_tant8-1]|uniref:Uncharacterized protein n=1 Tax=Flavobacterium phage vB_FspS_tant8-1 TaxID=2686278 RepID=A0A6B9LV28_9CAUD|nr:hypothetical protein HWC99_gp33 [Flavobacterium phage vB_FspS_tant8-1]QHB40964.1 hypothetical protein tant81_gp033 [Flavobacterium phage vB_FspS_tant8-1]
MGNFIIDQRLAKLEAKKIQLLKLKKEFRNVELKEVNETIARLKQWNIELAFQRIAKKIKESTQNLSKIIAQLKETTTKCSKAFQMLKDSTERISFVGDEIQSVKISKSKN